MSSQADRDWEDYQLGQQGTSTGSFHNQQGLNDRYQPSPVKQASGQNKVKQATKVRNTAEENDFNFLFALITFLITAYYLYNPADENSTAAVIGAGVASLIVGKFYKVIIIFSAMAVGFYIFSNIK